MTQAVKTPWLPGWAIRSFFYHIYPLGFLGAPPNNSGGEPVPRLADLRRWYDHIAGLGVDAIYFGPMFESVSHGYDTTDYFAIDRRLGDTALFREILGELRGRGMRVILDGVFHHTGREFFAFQDILRNKETSRYRDWYHINWGADSDYGDGFAYECFMEHQSLPRLNLNNPDTRKYMFDVCRYWLGDVGVDGWRLDVAHGIAPDFWWEFRRLCKEINPDCFLLGEVDRGDYNIWVAPDLLDSGTNYHLYYGLQDYFEDGDINHIHASLERGHHPEVGVFKELNLMTFIGNHDVSRVGSLVRHPQAIFPLLLFLMAAPGIPCLYYGEELGMLGLKQETSDHDMRQPMIPPDAEWPDSGRKLYALISELARIRRDQPALIFGDYFSLHSKPDTLAFVRRYGADCAVVALNLGDTAANLILDLKEANIPDGTPFADPLNREPTVLEAKNGKLSGVHLRPYSGRLLLSSALSS